MTTDRQAELARRREYEARVKDATQALGCPDMESFGLGECSHSIRARAAIDATAAPDEADHSDPHLFLAKNAQGADALWWGEGPDDSDCQELDLSSLRRGNRDAEKAVWEAVMGSDFVEDCTDWAPDA